MGESFVVGYFILKTMCYSSLESIAEFRSYYVLSSSSNQSLWSSLSSGAIFGNGNSKQPINFQDKPYFSLFSSNSTNPIFSKPPVQISTSTPPDYSKGERYQQPVSILDGVTSGAIFGGNSNSKSMFSGSHNYTNSPNNNFSRRGMVMPERRIVNQYKEAPENGLFPLFTATNTRVQTSQNLYYSLPPSTYRYPTMETDRFPRREPRMPQSLLDQMSSGAIFLGNSNRNQTVTQYNRLYTEMSPTIPQTNLYTALATKVVQSPFRQDHHKGEMLYEVYIKGELSLCINLSKKDFGDISVVNFEKTYAEKNVQIKPYGSNQTPQNVVILNQDKRSEIFQKAEKSFRITEVMFV